MENFDGIAFHIRNTLLARVLIANMEVENVHIDYILFDDGIGKSKSIRYEFGQEQWVSAHTGREGERLGPITRLEKTGDSTEDDSSVIRFEEYELPIDKGGEKIVLSYKDTWTIPSSTIYALVLPQGFVGDHVAIKYSNKENDIYIHSNKRVSGEGQLFYKCIVEFGGPVNVQARIEQDAERYKEEIESAERVSSPEDKEAAYQRVLNNLPSSSSVSLLLQLRRLFGLP